MGIVEPHEEIGGWFDFAALYDDAISGARAGAVFVEVGVWLGKSIIYMAERARMVRAPIRIIAIDNFAGSSCDDLDKTAEEYARSGEDLEHRFRRNLFHYGVDHMVDVYKADSVKGAELFADNSVYMAFLDADHRKEAVKRDALAWYHKVEPGGLLCGHDYNREEVKQGLAEALAEIGSVGATWDYAFAGCPTSFMYVKPGGFTKSR